MSVTRRDVLIAASAGFACSCATMPRAGGGGPELTQGRTCDHDLCRYWRADAALGEAPGAPAPQMAHGGGETTVTEAYTPPADPPTLFPESEFKSAEAVVEVLDSARSEHSDSARGERSASAREPARAPRLGRCFIGLPEAFK